MKLDSISYLKVDMINSYALHFSDHMHKTPHPDNNLFSSEFINEILFANFAF